MLFGSVAVIDVGRGSRVDFLAPGVLALAVMSTAFTGQAIATGFERRYGVLKRLGATPLPRSALMTAKTLAVLVVELLQIAADRLVALALGWRPHGNPAALSVAAARARHRRLLRPRAADGRHAARPRRRWPPPTWSGSCCWSAAGCCSRWTSSPAALEPVLALLPTSALSDGLREVLQHGAALPVRDVVSLAVWALASLSMASRAFKWE